MSDHLHLLYTLFYDVFLVKCKLICTVNMIFPITDFLNTGENIPPSQTEPKSVSIFPTATTLSGTIKSEFPSG